MLSPPILQPAPTPNKAAILGNPNVKPKALSVIVENIPSELIALPQWVTWRFVWKEKKWSKPPTNAKTNRLAGVDNPDTWASFAESLAAHQDGRADGIGIVLSGITGIDLMIAGTLAPAKSPTWRWKSSPASTATATCPPLEQARSCWCTVSCPRKADESVRSSWRT